MKKSHLLLIITLLFSVCGNLKAQTSSQFLDQLTFENFVNLIKNPYQEAAQKCGLSFLFEYETDASEEGDAGGSSTYYGWGIEKGKKQEYGYELKCTSDHACYFYYQEDTSRQAAMCFKNKADADRFMEKALEYGLVIMGNSYHIADQKLPNGTVKVDSFGDYSIITEMMKPEKDEDFHQGFYVIRFYYFS
jgi:hypothetical protein